MEVLTYKTSCVSALLDVDIITNNLKETDKICDPRFVMSAGTAWLRYNQGKTLYDLQHTLKTLGLNTIIVARPADTAYSLCLPGFNGMSNGMSNLTYVADFISNPYIIAQLPIRTDIELGKLRKAGYSCSARYASKLNCMKRPQLSEMSSMDIHTQLQWAGIMFSVEHVIVNPDEELNKDIARAISQGIKPEIRELTPLRACKEKIYAYINTDRDVECYVSAFGILEKTTSDGYTTSKLVIHLPTYLHELDEV